MKRAALSHGFTLVELLVVIAIIALLLAILLPTIEGVREMARISACGSNQHQLALGVLAYATDANGALPPRTADPGQAGGHFHAPTDFYYMYSEGAAGSGWDLGYMNLGLLYEDELIETGKVFFCPSLQYTPLTYGIHTPWPTPAYSDRIRSSYYYNPYTDGTGTGNASQRTYNRLLEMPSNAVLTLDFIWLWPNDELANRNAHWSSFGWNVARADGSANFVQPPEQQMLAIGQHWRNGSQNWDAFYEALEQLR